MIFTEAEAEVNIIYLGMIDPYIKVNNCIILHRSLNDCWVLLSCTYTYTEHNFTHAAL